MPYALAICRSDSQASSHAGSLVAGQPMGNLSRLRRLTKLGRELGRGSGAPARTPVNGVLPCCRLTAPCSGPGLVVTCGFLVRWSVSRCHSHAVLEQGDNRVTTDHPRLSEGSDLGRAHVQDQVFPSLSIAESRTRGRQGYQG
jgi:hypothetical protein